MDLEILNIASNTDNNKNIKNRTHIAKLKNSFNEKTSKAKPSNPKVIETPPRMKATG